MTKYNQFWGPTWWKMLHIKAIMYEPSQKQSFLKWFDHWKKLPCTVCEEHFEKHLQELPLTEDDLRDWKKLFLWTIGQHNLTNQLLGKKTVSYQTIWNYYMKEMGMTEEVISGEHNDLSGFKQGGKSDMVVPIVATGAMAAGILGFLLFK